MSKEQAPSWPWLLFGNQPLHSKLLIDGVPMRVAEKVESKYLPTSGLRDEPWQPGMARVGSPGLILANWLLCDLLHFYFVWQFWSCAFLTAEKPVALAAEYSFHSCRDHTHTHIHTHRRKEKGGGRKYVKNCNSKGCYKSKMYEKLKWQRLLAARLIGTDKLKRLLAVWAFERWQQRRHG